GSADITVAIAATDTYEAVAKKVQDATAGKVPEVRMSFENTTSMFFMSTKGMGADQNFTMNFSSPELASQVINAKDAGGVVIQEFNTGTAAADNKFMSAAAAGKIVFDGITIDNINTNKTTINGLT